MRNNIISMALAFILCISLGIFFTGCGEPSPKESVSTFLDALKSGDSETMNSVYADKDISILDVIFDSDNEGGYLASDSFEQRLTDSVLGFDYVIEDEAVNGDKATVKVTIKTYPMGEALTNAYNDMMSRIWELAFLEESELDAKLAGILNARWDEMTEKSYESEVEISLLKADGKWVVDSLDGNDDFINAITGNLINALDNLDLE